MGCLFEFLGEFFLEAFLGVSLTLLERIFPSISANERKQRIVRTTVVLISCIMVCAMFFGAILLLFADGIIEHNLGLLLVVIPACIIILYSIFCIIGNIVIKKRKK